LGSNRDCDFGRHSHRGLGIDAEKVTENRGDSNPLFSYFCFLFDPRLSDKSGTEQKLISRTATALM
jgi:hypothetical protein